MSKEEIINELKKGTLSIKFHTNEEKEYLLHSLFKYFTCHFRLAYGYIAKPLLPISEDDILLDYEYPRTNKMISYLEFKELWEYEEINKFKFIKEFEESIKSNKALLQDIKVDTYKEDYLFLGPLKKSGYKWSNGEEIYLETLEADPDFSLPAYYVILPNKLVEYRKYRTFFKCLGVYRLIEHAYCLSIEQKMKNLKDYSYKNWQVNIKVLSENSIILELFDREITVTYLNSSSTITSKNVEIIKTLLNNYHMQRVLQSVNAFYILEGSFKTGRTL